MSTRSCSTKKVYYTKSQARKAVKEIKSDHKLYYYECKYCGWYHLSSSDHERKVYVIQSENIVFTR